MMQNQTVCEAEEVIEAVRKSGADILNLRKLELTELPDSVRRLKNLRMLDLADNQLVALPTWLGQLTQLRDLYLSNNKLTYLPESTVNLKRLQTVLLDRNQLTELPEWLSRHKRLLRLDASGNKLVELPEWLGQLTQLQTVAFSGNELTALPNCMSQLSQIELLNLSDNELTELPAWLGQLIKLHILDLSGNQLTLLPECLGQLTRLRDLNLSDNQLTTVPDSIGQLASLYRLDLTGNELLVLPESMGHLKALKELFLHDNPSLGVSQSVLGPNDFDSFANHKEPANPSAILAVYFTQRKRNAKPLNEVKLLLVGHGRVGKTSLSKALREVPHDTREPETPGIERHPLSLLAGKSHITAHVWDFGGQEFLHQTHQFFFSERSIYVVVLCGRQGKPMQEAEYWLRLIRTYGKGSTVVIALNQIESHPFTVDEHFLLENYPEVKVVVRTDCAPCVGINVLRSLLGKLADAMPSVREKIDPSWAKVRTHLEDMEESFVTFAEYRHICAKYGVTTPEQQETLATILDCLGIALNYRQDARLRDTSVLKPRWLVDGIYTILRWLHKRETNGEMRIVDFPKALIDKVTYPVEMHAFLLALMEKFELCFSVEEKEGLYLVPALLNANQPRELKKFMAPNARRIQFRYEDVRPPGLLPRFIVRSHTLSEGQPRWLRGVVLARGKARVLVRGDYEGRVTDVYALGDKAEDRVWLTEFIVSEMRTLNDDLPVRTFVESEAQPGAWTELELLREAACRDEKTRSERAAGGVTVAVNVRQTLRDVESVEASGPKVNPLPLFICYAHANEKSVRQLVPSLKVLARRGYISPWRDTDLVPGDDWDETIQDRKRLNFDRLDGGSVTRYVKPVCVRRAIWPG